MPDTGRDLTSMAAWQNSNPDVATVSTTGRLTLVSPGTTTVTATYQGKLVFHNNISNSWAVGLLNLEELRGS